MAETLLLAHRLAVVLIAVAVMSGLIGWALGRWGSSKPIHRLNLRERAKNKGMTIATPPRRYRYRWWVEDGEEEQDGQD